MSEKPILFSAPMVKAILNGRKNITRRVVKGIDHECSGLKFSGGALQMRWTSATEIANIKCLFKVGQLLWVRETWQQVEHITSPGEPLSNTVRYRADGEDQKLGPWRPSIFMPRWASRITLEITKVRVERLHEITEEDAMAEGFETRQRMLGHGEDTPVRCFRELWEKINGKEYPWVSNPWVWVVSFKRIKP